MAFLLCYEFPAFRIFNPENGEITSFLNGKLEIEEDDPNYAVVMAEASRNPSIVVVEHVGTCTYCGAQFLGGNAKLLLAQHTKDVHFDKWLAAQDAEYAEVRNVEVKSRQGFACDVCQPLQIFGSADDLALHAHSMHAAAPEIDEAGNAKDVPASRQPRRRRPGEVDADA